MPKTSLLLLTLVLIPLLLAARGHADEPLVQNTIRWTKPGIAPLFIFTGEKKNKGIGDLIFDRFEQILPQYQHEIMRANYIRTLTEIRHGNNTCAILHHNEAREKFVHFSNALFIIPSYQLYILASQKNKFSQIVGLHSGKISLAKLLENSQTLRMAHSRGHSYGEKLDRIFAQYHDKLQISKGHSGQKSLIKMLLAGRVDLILEPPLVLNYHLREFKTGYSELHKLTLIETPAYIPVAIGCPKTVWGKNLVGTLNKVLPQLHQEIKESVVDWLEPEEVEAYRQAHNRHFSFKKSM